jgi:hypothetical protein
MADFIALGVPHQKEYQSSFDQRFIKTFPDGETILKSWISTF